MKLKSFLPFAIIALICLVVYLGCSGGTDPPKTYTLTINITGQGSVAKSPDLSKYTSGTSVELTADPDSGYRFENWSGDLEGTANPDTIEMTEDRVVTSTFAEIQPQTYTLTINIIGQGSVAKSPDDSKYTSGTSVELTAEPDLGYRFDKWSGDLESTANPDTIEMTGDKVVTATFAEVRLVTVTGTVSLAEGGDLVRPVAFLDSSHSGRIVIFRSAGWSADPETGEFTIQFDLEDLDSLEAIITGFDDVNENDSVDVTDPIGWWDVDRDSIWDDPDDFVMLRPFDTVSGAEVVLYPQSSATPSARKQPSGIIRLR